MYVTSKYKFATSFNFQTIYRFHWIYSFSPIVLCLKSCIHIQLENIYKPYGARNWQMSSPGHVLKRTSHTANFLPRNSYGSLQLGDLPGNSLLWLLWVPKAQESLLGCSHSNTGLAGFLFRHP